MASTTDTTLMAVAPTEAWLRGDRDTQLAIVGALEDDEYGGLLGAFLIFIAREDSREDGDTAWLACIRERLIAAEGS